MKYLVLLLTLAFSPLSFSNNYPTETIVTSQNEEIMRDDLIGEVFGCVFPATESFVLATSSWNGHSFKQLTSGAKLFEKGGSKLVIFHAGHNQDALSYAAGAALVNYTFTLGHDVLVINMPSGDHSRFASTLFPMRAFMTPIAESVNYALANKSYQSVVMSGLSGGGWSTVLYAAMDERIELSVPVAGSWPKYLRVGHDINTVGDYEQQLPGITASYLDLYALATSNGREQVQVFNSYDPCCFAGYDALDYLTTVSDAADDLGGKFDIIIVENNQHTVHSSVFPLISGSVPPPPPVVAITAEWMLDDNSGTSLAEVSGAYNAIVYNNPLFGSNPLVGSGSSIEFNGVNQYALVPDSTALRPGTREYSIEMWASFTGVKYGVAFGKFSQAFPYIGSIVFFNYANGAVTPGKIQFRDKSGSGFEVNSVSTGLNDGQSRYYVFQRRNDNGVWKLEIYINGILDSQQVLSSVSDLNTTEPLHLFSRPGASQYVSGTFDNTKYHLGKSLTPSEILLNYQ